MKDSVDEATKQRRLAEVIDFYESFLPDANGKFVGDIQLVQIEKVCDVINSLMTSSIPFRYRQNQMSIG